eukprot:Gb_09005 [translate_table: standard]
MADKNISETAITGRDAGESSDATVEIKLKTLDSQIYTFRVNRNMPVPALKEQIATITGVPSEQQRLICRGKVLKDDQLLSDYHVEDGHTLHLVVRQPLQPSHSSTMPGSSGSDGTNEQGADPTASASRNRIGQVSHSVVLGTFNIPDQGDGGIPDLNRIIGAVLNSIGVGNLAPGNGATAMPPVLPTDNREGTGLEGQTRLDNASGGSQMVNQPQPQIVSDIQYEPVTQPRIFPQSMVIPDALTTLSQYLNRMEQAFSLNGFDNHPHSSTFRSSEVQDQGNASSSPSVSRGLPTPAALGVVIRHTQQLLSGQAGAAFSQLAGQLQDETTVTDPAVRSQIQSAAMRDGLMMQQLGALLLELGRTTVTLRMGQSHAESVVNAGPAVYISPSGPNPIMVQPPTFHAGASFGAFPIGAVQPTAGVAAGPVGTGDVPRNISIHIHAGTSLSPGGIPVPPGGTSVAPGANTEQRDHVIGLQGTGQADQAGNGSAAPRETGPVRVVPVRTVVAAGPARPPTEAAGTSFSVFYPLLARFQQQMSSGQGTPMRSLAQAFVNGGQSGIADTAQQQSMDAVPLPGILAQMQIQSQNVNGGVQTLNSLSAPVATSASATPLSAQQASQNQTGSSTEQDSTPQGQSTENFSRMDADGRNRVRNDEQSSVTVAGGGEIANLVNSVLQHVAEAYSRSGRADQQQPDQQQPTSRPSTGDESTAEEPKLNNKPVNDKGAADSSSENTSRAGPGLSSTKPDMQEYALTSTSSNAIASTRGAGSQGDMMQLRPSRECTDSGTSVPVGLGLGGLQPLPSKRRPSKQNRRQQTSELAESHSEIQNSAATTGGHDIQSSIARGQNVLKALVSQRGPNVRRSDENGSSAQLPNGLAQMLGGMVSGGNDSGGRVDVENIMSHLLHTPAVNDLLRGVSEQTGVVAPAALSNMMEQVTQSPLLRNTMQQMAQQLGEQGQGLEDMLSGLGGRQGGIDFSRVMQQMMPIVSQVFGRASRAPESSIVSETQPKTSNEDHRSLSEDNGAVDPKLQIDLEPTIQKLERHDPPEEVFRTVVNNAMALFAANDGTLNGVNASELSCQLSDTEGLANEYLAMLNRDFITRLQSDSGSVDDS